MGNRRDDGKEMGWERNEKRRRGKEESLEREVPHHFNITLTTANGSGYPQNIFSGNTNGAGPHINFLALMYKNTVNLANRAPSRPQDVMLHQVNF